MQPFAGDFAGVTRYDSLASDRAHFTVKELAATWRLDESTVRRLFKDEKDVFIIGSNSLRAKRKQYATLRIPGASCSGCTTLALTKPQLRGRAVQALLKCRNEWRVVPLGCAK